VVILSLAIPLMEVALKVLLEVVKVEEEALAVALLQLIQKKTNINQRKIDIVRLILN
jgi:hypothetical protein